MQVWCFVGERGLWALTADKHGENLPAHLGPWTYLKEAMLDGTAQDEREAAALIQEHGFCCFDAHVDG